MPAPVFMRWGWDVKDGVVVERLAADIAKNAPASTKEAEAFIICKQNRIPFFGPTIIT